MASEMGVNRLMCCFQMCEEYLVLRVVGLDVSCGLCDHDLLEVDYHPGKCILRC